MRRAQVREIGALAIGLMFVLTLTLGVLVTSDGLSHAAGATPVGVRAGEPMAKAMPTAPAKPAVHPSTTTTVTAVYTAPITSFTQLPTTLGVLVTVSGASINTTTTTVWMAIYDNITSQLCSIISDNKTVTTGNQNYSFLLEPVLLLAGTCPGIQNDPVLIQTNVTVLGGLFGGTNVTVWANGTSSLIFAPLAVKLVSPNGAVGVGNATFVATYTAQYLLSVQLLVWAPDKSSILENASLIWPSANTPASVTWYAPSIGSYPFAVTVTTTYGSSVQSGNITVLSNGGGTVWLNNSNFRNATVLPGVSGAVAGTILLLVGLIIGMLVALAVASLMRSPAPAAGAQPWQSSSSTTPAANTCSVCGKSVPSADELAAHAKSEHGMG